MKRIYILLTSTVFVFSLQQAKAQYDAEIKGSIADATALVNAYGKPVLIGLGEGSNGGWFNTAKTKKLLKFELRISATDAIVPTSDKTFDVTKIGLSDRIQPDNPNNVIAPTVAGNQNALGPLMDSYVYENGTPIRTGQFNTSSGKVPSIPTPQFQLTVGFLGNTDITVRGIPNVNIGGTGYSVSSIGFAIRHNILKDFAKKDEEPPFDLSVAFAYSTLSLTIPVNVGAGVGAQPDPNASTYGGTQNSDFSNQKLKGTINNLLGQLLISKKIAFFTPFVAAGYNTTKATVGTSGNFPFITSTSEGTNYYTTYQNVVNINETTISGLRVDLGLQLNLAFFNIYASASESKYMSVNGGIGLSF